MKNKIEQGKYIIFLDIDGTVFDGRNVPEKIKRRFAVQEQRDTKSFSTRAEPIA